MIDSKPSEKDRRKYRRLDLNLPIAFEILEEDTRDCSINFAKTRNVSTGGAYFESISDARIKPDMKLKIVFDTPESLNSFGLNNVFKSPKLEAVAKVVRVTDVVEEDQENDVMTRKVGIAVSFDEDLRILF